ncbi:Dipeptidyl aminopeptidase-like protein 6 [Argiope bruennichi]|uniref:Dipeptidyl aminopeptidase-like protein 6 n=1 Tax=Argiope bruennichi TaxID=94029 RepID=A0A8T0F5S9_ARGBR|nr:Dipeptidyl aminopeptidase-like protein 6 [Argiope bruennichi]
MFHLILMLILFCSQDLASEEEEQRNWRGICIALLVIATVCSLIITSIVLLAPGPEEPRVKNPRFSLEEVITGEYEPRLFNGSWISGKYLLIF